MHASDITPTRSFRRLLFIVAVVLGACVRAPDPGVPSPKLSDPEYLRALRLMVPVAGTRPDRLSNTFQAPRGNGGARDHLAIDIMAPKGTPVLAAVDGEILRVATNELGGKTIDATDRGRRFVYY